VGSAVLMTALVILTAVRVLRVEAGPEPAAAPVHLDRRPRAERRRAARAAERRARR